MIMSSQVAQAAPNVQQHLQPLPSHQQQQQPLQPISATQALQMQQKIQIGPNSNQEQPNLVIGPATAAVAAQNRSQHIPTVGNQNQQQQRQFQYQQRNPTNGGIPVGHQQQQQQQQIVHPQMQQQPPQYQQQQRVNSANVNVNVRPPQFHSQPVVMPNNTNNVSANHTQQQQPQQMQPQYTRPVNPQQRNPQYSQQQQQQHPSQNNQPTIHPIPTPATTLSISTPVPTTPTAPSTNSSHITPLYERLVTEEVKELKEYLRIIESQSRRISDLEKIHTDLTKRLEYESSQRQRLEYTLQHRERSWKSTVGEVKLERDRLQTNIKEEKIKVERLLDMVNRLQNEIQSMIKNKFSGSTAREREPSVLNTAGGGIKRVGSRSRSESGASGSRTEERHTTNAGGRNTPKQLRHIGPNELLACNGSAEAVRERNAFTSLLDFFGM